jgi:hypothetical protein
LATGFLDWTSSDSDSSLLAFLAGGLGLDFSGCFFPFLASSSSLYSDSLSDSLSPFFAGLPFIAGGYYFFSGFLIAFSFFAGVTTFLAGNFSSCSSGDSSESLDSCSESFFFFLESFLDATTGG